MPASCGAANRARGDGENAAPSGNLELRTGRCRDAWERVNAAARSVSEENMRRPVRRGFEVR